MLKQKIKSVVKGTARALGFDVRRVSKSGVIGNSIPRGSRIHVGCGDKVLEGYVSCDLRPLKHVQLVCRAWEVSRYCNGSNEIYSRHLLEHLTFSEANYALRDWYKALKVGGVVKLVVPNLSYHLSQIENAVWDEANMSDKWSNARHGMAGLYGWQRECDPRTTPYNNSYWDVHKSGYTPESIKLYFSEAGFTNIETSIVDEFHLHVTAEKTVEHGERQVSGKLGGIAIDHVNRYRFSSKYIKEGSCVLDAACGVGYGSKFIADSSKSWVVGVDIDPEVIEFANYHYRNHPERSPEFQVCDVACLEEIGKVFDVVISFETIEHVTHPSSFLRSVRSVISDKGLFFVSTPNEDVAPFDPNVFKYHKQHFTGTQFESILNKNDFVVIEKYSQVSKATPEIQKGWGGRYNIAVCETR